MKVTRQQGSPFTGASHVDGTGVVPYTDHLDNSGTSLHDLLEFGEWHGEEPKGWVVVDLDGVGIGGKAELRAWILQIRVLENHQNGKDTHVRGVQIFGRDEEEARQVYGWDKAAGERSEEFHEANEEAEGMEPPEEPEWMSMPEIR